MTNYIVLLGHSGVCKPQRRRELITTRKRREVENHQEAKRKSITTRMAVTVYMKVQGIFLDQPIEHFVSHKNPATVHTKLIILHQGQLSGAASGGLQLMPTLLAAANAYIIGCNTS